MILRFKGSIAHGHDTKLLGEDGEDVTTGWGTKPSPKVKPFEEDHTDTPTMVRGTDLTPRRILF